MLYTRTGDAGTSRLFGSTERLPKECPIYEALGTLDELCSLLGVCRAKAKETCAYDVARELLRAQESLFILQASCAGAPVSFDATKVTDLEASIAFCEECVGTPRSFLIPGETTLSSFLDYARAVARRAERAVLLAQVLTEAGRVYLNRLSSLLYALARYAAYLEKARERAPSYQ